MNKSTFSPAEGEQAPQQLSIAYLFFSDVNEEVSEHNTTKCLSDGRIEGRQGSGAKKRFAVEAEEVRGQKSKIGCWSRSLYSFADKPNDVLSCAPILV